MGAITNKPIGISEGFLYTKGHYMELFTVTKSNKDINNARYCLLKTAYNFYGNQHQGTALLLVATAEKIKCKLVYKAHEGGAYDFYSYYDEANDTLHVYVYLDGGNGSGVHSVYIEQRNNEDIATVSFSGSQLVSIPEGAVKMA